MNNTNISVGDYVSLGAANGLGRGVFEVVHVWPGDPIHKLFVRGANGEVWPARIEGARKLTGSDALKALGAARSAGRVVDVG